MFLVSKGLLYYLPQEVILPYSAPFFCGFPGFGDCVGSGDNLFFRNKRGMG